MNLPAPARALSALGTLPIPGSEPFRLFEGQNHGFSRALVLGSPMRTRRGSAFADFEVLIHGSGGHLYWLQVRDRHPPELADIVQMAELISGQFPTLPRRPASNSTEEYLSEQIGLCIRLRDDCLDDLAQKELSSIVARSLLWKVVQGNSADHNRMRTKISEELQSAVLDFFGHLHPEATALSRTTRSLRPSTYNFLIGPTERQGIYRRQALHAVPLLLERLCSHADARSASVIASIDEAQPLFESISRIWNVPRSAVRALAKVFPNWLNTDHQPSFDVLLRIISDIDHNHRPRGKVEWFKMTTTLGVISRLSKRGLLSSSNRVWIGAVARQGFPIPTAEDDGITLAGRMIDELLAAIDIGLRFHLQRSGNRDYRVEDIAKARQHFASSLSIPRLTDLARRFCDERRREELAFVEEVEALSLERWPSPLATDIEAGDLIVKCLRTSDELREEGAAMRSCVGTYGVECIQGRSQIFSIRRRDGLRISTLEAKLVRYPEGNYECQVMQHHSAGNGRAPAAALAAEVLLQKTIARGGESLDRYWGWKVSIAGKSRKEREQIAYVTPMVRALAGILPRHYSLEQMARLVFAFRGDLPVTEK